MPTSPALMTTTTARVADSDQRLTMGAAYEVMAAAMPFCSESTAPSFITAAASTQNTPTQLLTVAMAGIWPPRRTCGESG
jgi:hypothetical protein